jgi:hypothetical protein
VEKEGEVALRSVVSVVTGVACWEVVRAVIKDCLDESEFREDCRLNESDGVNDSTVDICNGGKDGIEGSEFTAVDMAEECAERCEKKGNGLRLFRDIDRFLYREVLP